MSVRFGNEETFVGAVLKTYDHMWADGMLDVYAVVWNHETQKIEHIQTGYIAIEGSNLMGGSAKVDATRDTWREVIRYLKPSAYRAFADSVTKYKREIHVGTTARVVRGKKVPKGTVVKVFWIGEKPTFLAKRYEFVRETETICGCYDENGNKVWIKAEYLENIDPLKSPNAKERKKFIHNYIDERARELGAPWVARRRGVRL